MLLSAFSSFHADASQAIDGNKVKADELSSKAGSSFDQYGSKYEKQGNELLATVSQFIKDSSETTEHWKVWLTVPIPSFVHPTCEWLFTVAMVIS